MIWFLIVNSFIHERARCSTNECMKLCLSQLYKKDNDLIAQV